MCQSPHLGNLSVVNSDLPAGLEFISQTVSTLPVTAFTRWDEKAGLQRDAIRSQ